MVLQLFTGTGRFNFAVLLTCIHWRATVLLFPDSYLKLVLQQYAHEWLSSCHRIKHRFRFKAMKYIIDINRKKNRTQVRSLRLEKVSIIIVICNL